MRLRRAPESPASRTSVTLSPDLPGATAFWHDLLGFDESYNLKKDSNVDVHIAFIKINDHQHVELFNEAPTHPPNMMSHVCFTVDDIEQMRAYLRLQKKTAPAPDVPH